ncbi:hypothetical protein EDD22DRAFT_493537 [Suillus occidentalis]|nr:hypothetical protein EDD22DRAFT_493537 [Suillus occidentalis]
MTNFHRYIVLTFSIITILTSPALVYLIPTWTTHILIVTAHLYLGFGIFMFYLCPDLGKGNTFMLIQIISSTAMTAALTNFSGPEAQCIQVGYLLLGLAIAYLIVVILIIGLSFEIYFGHSETVINMLISTITPDPESHSKYAPLPQQDFVVHL